MKFEKDELPEARSMPLICIVQRDIVIDEHGVPWSILDHEKRQEVRNKTGERTGWRFPAQQLAWKRDVLVNAGERVWLELPGTDVDTYSAKSLIEVIRAAEEKFDASLAGPPRSPAVAER